MKKQLLYSFAAMVGLVLTGCNGDYDDWANPQSYEQEVAKEAYGVTVSAGSDATIQMPVADDAVRLVTVSAGSEEVVGFTLRKLLVNGTAVNGTFEGSDLVVSAAELSNLVQQTALTRAHKTYNLKVEMDFGANLSNGDAVAFDAQSTASITTQLTPAVDAKGYYVLGDFEGQGWALDAPIWMEDNGDGTYTATVTTTSDGSNWFKFYQGSYQDDADWDTVNQGQMGCAVNGDASLFGFVVWPGDAEHPDGVQTPVITGAGTFELTLDLNNYTYSVREIHRELYYVGDIGGWSTFYPLAQKVEDDVESYIGYYYIAKVDNVNTWGFKFTTTPDWDNPQYGGGASDGTMELGGSNNIDLPAGMVTDFYQIKVTPSALTFELTPITSISIVGDAVNHDSNWGTDIDLTFDTTELCWTATATLNAGSFKFRANHDWAISWGGVEADALTSDNGANLNVTEDGTYTVKFWPNCDGRGVYTME